MIGQWEAYETPSEAAAPPDILPWEASLPYPERGIVQNRGCPADYFAQFVGIGEPGSTPVPGTTYALRCRRMATTTPQTIVSESGITLSEALTVYTEAISDTVEDIKEAAKLTLPWAVIALGVFAALMLRR